ncbi:SusC/RagA family TonB-linked outer membrane protein [Adhaeribacter aquaticus]|uniref:SusC/RagA family TonB-linked outer membrane protein n=1 Tax=Adhaeribacter aquaticus TaxID=299567 RepID=UPI0004224816|nr:TonB-dependent receptor [Adhaeribacter aquaticus]
MKKVVRNVSSCLLLYSCIFQPSYGQVLASNVPLKKDRTSTQQTRSISLKESLLEVGSKYNVHIFFKTEFVQNKIVVLEAKAGQKTSVENELKSLLVPHNLVYKKVSENFYVISPKEEASLLLPDAALVNERYESLVNEQQQELDADNLAIQITGKITDERGEGIPGVTVVLKGTSNGTTSNPNGTYSLNVPTGSENGVLVFSYIGYTAQEVSINNRSVINVQLAPDTKALEEVVVVGYGTQRKTDVTGALSSISTKEFAQQPVTRVDQVLQGRAAGVQVTQAGGAPGGEARVRIRGANSVLGNNDPLYVVDGFVGADFTTVNPNDIESIQVLKDASSTAIYGSRGANGVVIITTKKGKKGGVQVNYEGQAITSEVIKRWDVLNAQEFAETANARSAALGSSPIFTPAQMENIRQNPRGTDWQDLVFRRANGQQHQLGVSGGNDKTTFLISGNYLNQDGIIENTSYKRYTLRSNIATQVNDKMSLRLNISGSRLMNHNTGLQSGTANPVVQALAWSPTTPARDANGSITATDPVGSVAVNPLALLYDRNTDVERNIINAIGGINYKLPIKGLALDLQYAVNYLNGENKTFNGLVVTRNNANASRFSSEQITLQSTNSLTYNRTFNEVHSINAVAVFEAQKFTDNNFTATSNSLLYPELGYYNLSLAGSYTPTSGYNEWGLLSTLGRINYGFKDKYLLTVAVRRDASSKFAKGNQASVFPSIGVGYNLAEEDLIKNLNLFSTLKLRGSWGMTGSQAINPYATMSRYNTNAPVAFSIAGVSSGIQLGNPGNRNLRWETTKQKDIGIELGFFNGRLTFEGDYFVKNTVDLLLNRSLPAYVGGGTQTINVGEIQNKGFEFAIGATILEKEGLSWTSNLNMSTVKNQVVSLGGIAPRIGQGTNVGAGMSTTNEFMLIPGQSLGSYWGIKYLGTWKPNEADLAAKYDAKPGDSRYEDLNNDGRITTDDFQVIGKGIPTTTAGWNNIFNYKAFTLNVFFTGVFGIDKLNYTRAAAMSGSGDARQYILSEIKNRYIPGTNETSDIPAFSATNRVFTQSSRFVEKGDFIRLKNVSLSYQVPAALLRNKGNIRVFGSATNLWTITEYKGIDPESSNIGAGTDTAQGIDYGAYPNSKTYTVGLNLTF